MREKGEKKGTKTIEVEIKKQIRERKREIWKVAEKGRKKRS